MDSVLASRFNKEKFLDYLAANPDQVEETFQLAFTSEKPESWRAAWVLNHATSKNDIRIKKHAQHIIDILSTKEDGHQRELLKLLAKIEISEELEGVLFDKCVTIWEAVEKSPSVRIIAFRILVKVAKKYPEMKNEIEFLTQSHYTDPLSPGIKRSLEKVYQSLT
ncbi:MAG: hypothetical protein ACI9GM_001054 [Salibacteraceae bacterium]|jgi:hypothetical protein